MVCHWGKWDYQLKLMGSHLPMIKTTGCLVNIYVIYVGYYKPVNGLVGLTLKRECPGHPVWRLSKVVIADCKTVNE